MRTRRRPAELDLCQYNLSFKDLNIMDSHTSDQIDAKTNTAAVNDASKSTEHPLIKKISERIVHHPRLRHALDKIIEAIEVTPAYVEARNVLVIGPEGSGKTTLLDELARRYGVMKHVKALGHTREIGILLSTLPSPATPRSCAIQLLKDLGDLREHYGTALELTYQLMKLMETCNVKAVAINEFHQLLTHSHHRSRNVREVQEWIKALTNKTKIPFILVGMPESAIVIDGEPQIRRRFKHAALLGNFDRPNSRTGENEIGQFATDLLMFAVCEGEWFDDASDFQRDFSLATRLHLATRGNPEAIKDLVIDATRIALRSDDREVRIQHFAKAYQSLIPLEKAANAARAAMGDTTYPEREENPFVIDYGSVESRVWAKAA